MGSAVVAANSLALTADSLPLNAFGFFLVSQTQGTVPNPGGSQGNLCLGGQIARFSKQIGATSSTGTVSNPPATSRRPSPVWSRGWTAD